MLDWFANLWEIDKGEYWGYVTTGGTEGNLHGILTGSDLLNFISRAFSCITNSEYPKYNDLLINSYLLYREEGNISRWHSIYFTGFALFNI